MYFAQPPYLALFAIVQRCILFEFPNFVLKTLLFPKMFALVLSPIRLSKVINTANCWPQKDQLACRGGELHRGLLIAEATREQLCGGG